MLHPEDRTAPAEETGPWRALLLAGTVAWVALAALDHELLATGSSPWALVRSAYTLVVAPAVAATLLQDARVRGDSAPVASDADESTREGPDRDAVGADHDSDDADSDPETASVGRSGRERAGVGRARFGYALAALVFPPACLAYLLHQRLRGA